MGLLEGQLLAVGGIGHVADQLLQLAALGLHVAILATALFNLLAILSQEGHLEILFHGLEQGGRGFLQVQQVGTEFLHGFALALLETLDFTLELALLVLHVGLGALGLSDTLLLLAGQFALELAGALLCFVTEFANRTLDTLHGFLVVSVLLDVRLTSVIDGGMHIEIHRGARRRRGCGGRARRHGCSIYLVRKEFFLGVCRMNRFRVKRIHVGIKKQSRKGSQPATHPHDDGKMSTFRDKPHRKMSQVTTASSAHFSSIDAFHQAKTTDFLHQLPMQRSEWVEQLNDLQRELETLRAREPYGLPRIHKEYVVEKMIHELTEKIETIDSGNIVHDYWIQTTPLLTQYYHPQTTGPTQGGPTQGGPTQGGPTQGGPSPPIMGGKVRGDHRTLSSATDDRDDAAAAAAKEEKDKKTTIVEELLQTKEGIEKKILFDRYFQMVMEPSKTSVSLHTDVDKSWSYCTTCKTEKIPIQHEGMMICPQCGFSEYTLIHSDRPCFKEKQQQEALNSYTYKRINHFNEWLSEFQAKELTIVPPEVMETIQKELKKHRLLHANIQYTDMRTILKKLHYNRYYEHIPYIMSKLTGKQAAVISKETEELLRNMFRQLQPPFEKHCPEGRSNFLSYRYVLRKMFEIIGLYDYANDMMLPKSKQKILEYDSIWYKICKDLKWPFHSTSSVRNLQPNQPTDLERLLKRKESST